MNFPNATGCQPNLGNDISLCGLFAQPRLRWKYSKDTLYSVFLIDINPFGEKNGNLAAFGILWWLVDILGTHLSASKAIYEYQAPTPNYGVGSSRFALLVYKQPSYKIDWSEEPKVSAT